MHDRVGWRQNMLLHMLARGQTRGAHLPDTGELAHLNVPAHGDALGPDDVQALCI